ncbi:hypothetical protein F5Y08DRAFT_7506 [Xylaria arbuscula]|nr:hypothetical protein F5Y08DRAFT_7506 [Xylaria arbuscula]
MMSRRPIPTQIVYYYLFFCFYFLGIYFSHPLIPLPLPLIVTPRTCFGRRTGPQFHFATPQCLLIALCITSVSFTQPSPGTRRTGYGTELERRRRYYMMLGESSMVKDLSTVSKREVIDSRDAHPMCSGEMPSLWTFYQMATTRANTSKWGHTLESRIAAASMERLPL